LLVSLRLVYCSMSSQQRSSYTTTASPTAEWSSKTAERSSTSDDEEVKSDRSFLKAEALQPVCAHCGNKEGKELALLICSRCKYTK
jgi:hypothetical protein